MRLVTALLLALGVTVLDVQPAQAAGWDIQITQPTNFQTYQRDSNNQATFTVAGWYVGNPRQIQASWRGSPWRTIDNTLTRGKGSFKGTLTGTAGQGTLVVRFSGTNLIDKAYYVGIGDILVAAGQSNMMGYGFKPHQYTPTTIKATMYGNNDKWGELRDPYDSATNQVDRISRDTLAAGSFIAWIANAHIRETSVPLAIIPAARGGSNITQWAHSTNRATLYGSMLRRVKATGGKAKAVLWVQGEADSPTEIDTYANKLSDLADNINHDFRGAKLVPALIGPAPYTGTQRSGPRIGTIQAIKDNDHLVMGPALYDVNLDDEGGDGTHFRSDRDLATAGYRFWLALDHAFYGGETGYGPQLEEATLIPTESVIRLEFDTDLTSTANPETFWVHTDGIRIPITSVSAGGETITLTLAAPPVGHTTVSYGHDNRSAIGAAVYNGRGLPAVPFHDEEVNQ